MSLVGLLFLLIAVNFDASTLAVNFNNTATRSTSQYFDRLETVKDYHVAMLDAVNRERLAYGLPKLCLNNKLQNAALEHSKDMAKIVYLSHTGSDGSTMSSRVKAAGYRWTYVGENVAAGQLTVASVVASWMKSKPHRANILSSKATMFECGYAYSLRSKYKHYWTQSFASSSSERCN